MTAPLVPADVRERILELIDEGEGEREVAEALGVSRWSVRKAIQGREAAARTYPVDDRRRPIVVTDEDLEARWAKTAIGDGWCVCIQTDGTKRLCPPKRAGTYDLDERGVVNSRECGKRPAPGQIAKEPDRTLWYYVDETEGR